MTTSQARAPVAFTTILFATDFSSSSEAAIPYILALAGWHDSKVIIAHAIERYTDMPGVPSPPEVDLEWQEAERGMQKYRDSRTFAGLRHEFVLEKGNPLAVVFDLIAHEEVDLVVLGTHGRTGVRKLVAGSIAEQIFRKCACPILTVGPDIGGIPGQSWQPKLILLATDFSNGSVHALPYAIWLAEENQAELILLHVVPLVPGEQETKLGQVYQKRLGELISPVRGYDCNMEFEVRFDLAAPGILNMARDKQADLIVMGAHRTPLPGIESHVGGSTVYEVISHAHCPVLTVRS